MIRISKCLIATSIFISVKASGIEPPPFKLPEHTYKCEMTDAVGFEADRHQWASTSFDVSGNAFLIRPLTAIEKKKFPGYTYGAGDHIGIIHSTCQSPRTSLYHCRHIEGLGETKFSANSGRFISTFTGGYWFGGNNGKPALAIGTCSRV